MIPNQNFQKFAVLNSLDTNRQNLNKLKVKKSYSQHKNFNFQLFCSKFQSS